MKFLGMAGFDTQQILAGIPAVLSLARAGAIELGMAADIASDVGSAFGLAADEIGHIADVMAVTASSANTNIEMMGETLKYAAPLAKAAGQSLEDTATAIGIMANSGIKASMAGTDLALIMKLLGGEAQQALSKMGVQSVDAEGNVRSVVDVMQELGAATKDMSEAQRLKFFSDTFDRAAKSVIIPAELEEREEDENPLARPAKISWSSAAYQRATLFNADRKPIRNAAGELFDPQEVEDERWVISVKKNVAAVPRWILGYRMVVNDGAVRIQGLTFPKETLRLQGLSISEEQIENRVPFYVVSFELHFREEGWRRPLINRGYNELVESTNPQEPGKRLMPILLGLRGAEERPQDPVFLDREGKAFRDSSGQITNDVPPSSIVTFQVKLHKTKPFGVLPLR